MKTYVCRVLALFAIAVCVTSSLAIAQRPGAVGATYTNPIDLPYRFQPQAPSRREAADPTMVVYRREYWLFASKSGGYWHSKDLLNWVKVVPTGLPLEDYAPTVVAMDDQLYFTAFNSKAIYSAADPGKGEWKKVAEIAAYGDPALFLDDDGKLYMYSGCSSKTPLMVTELDRKTFQALRSIPVEVSRDTAHRGWEVPGENNDEPLKGTWVEGSWMTKHDGIYYLQYAAAGTQYRTYADGVLVSDSATGPFHYAPYSPFSFKPTGFISGAGHGSTFKDLNGRWWHIATMTISVRHSYERRLGLFPVRFLDDGQMIADTYLADYPHRLDGDRGLTGWMLLSYEKTATASSVLDGHGPELAVDENVRDWWSAKSGNPGEWLRVDLGTVSQVNAVQINFADEGSTALGDIDDAYRYVLEGSSDGKNWKVLVDHRTKGTDSPHDYEPLTQPARVRFLRLTNEHMPAGALFSVSGLRIFGRSGTMAPGRPTSVNVQRDESDARAAIVSWPPSEGAEMYVVRYGVAPDRLLGSYQIYHATKADVRSLNTGVSYYFTVDAVNSYGVTAGPPAVSVK